LSNALAVIKQAGAKNWQSTVSITWGNNMITLEQAKALKVGTMLYHTINKNADGTPQRWKVNGKVKTWKTKPDCVKVPVKHGLYTFGYVNEIDLEFVSLTE
jgi:hypothetical protein